MNIFRGHKAITLISLIITIVILIILIGLTINLGLGEEGIIKKTKLASEEYVKAQIQEEIQIELTDVVLEHKSENTEITSTIIQKALKDRITGINILENLTGDYKGYEYEIDENYNVFITGKVTNPIKMEVNYKIGTSYIEITVKASSEKASIVQYEYIIDGVTISQEEQTYIIENLEPQSEHKIKVVAIDEKENRRESREISLKTEARTYLYKSKEEYIELTGGWEDGDSNIGTFTKKEDCMNLYCEGPTSSTYWHSIRTVKGIDITGYTKIVYRCKIANPMYYYSGMYYNWLVMGVCNPKYTNYYSFGSSFKASDGGGGFQNDFSGKVINKEINLNDIGLDSNIVYPTIAFAKQFSKGSYTADIDIYEVWLEK